jgi:hypothetical protein
MRTIAATARIVGRHWSERRLDRNLSPGQQKRKLVGGAEIAFLKDPLQIMPCALALIFLYNLTACAEYTAGRRGIQW